MSNLFKCDYQLKKRQCQFVRVFVCLSVPFFLYCAKRQKSSNGVSGMSQGGVKCVSRVFHRSVWGIKFKGSFKGVSRKIQVCFENTLKIFHRS